jgi:hypothetical protein
MFTCFESVYNCCLTMFTCVVDDVYTLFDDVLPRVFDECYMFLTMFNTCFDDCVQLCLTICSCFLTMFTIFVERVLPLVKRCVITRFDDCYMFWLTMFTTCLMIVCHAC